MILIPIVDEIFGTLLKNLESKLRELEIKGRIETIQTIALLKSTWIYSRVPRDLRRLAVTETSVKEYKLKLVEKIPTDRYCSYIKENSIDPIDPSYHYGKG